MILTYTDCDICGERYHNEFIEMYTTETIIGTGNETEFITHCKSCIPKKKQETTKSEIKFKLHKMKSKRGCTSYAILIQGEENSRGTVKKLSEYHNGYKMQCTWYIVWMGKNITIQPDIYWPDYMGRGTEFKQRLNKDRLSYAENGHKVRKRMMDWIRQELTNN